LRFLFFQIRTCAYGGLILPLKALDELASGLVLVDNLEDVGPRKRSICNGRHPSHTVDAFREPDGLFQFPIFKIQDFDGAALGAGHVGVYAVWR
jgi:hypothetical protein